MNDPKIKVDDRGPDAMGSHFVGIRDEREWTAVEESFRVHKPKGWTVDAWRSQGWTRVAVIHEEAAETPIEAALAAYKLVAG